MERERIPDGSPVTVPDSFYIVSVGAANNYFYYVNEQVARGLIRLMGALDDPCVSFDTLSGGVVHTRASCIATIFSSTPESRAFEDAIIAVLNDDHDDDEENAESWRG